MAYFGRRRIPSSSSPLVAEKGQFVVYRVDHRWLVMPLLYLNFWIFQELLRISKEEFGLSSEGPITLPCDAALMEHVVSVIQRGAGEDLEKALLNSIISSHCAGWGWDFVSQNMLVCGH